MQIVVGGTLGENGALQTQLHRAFPDVTVSASTSHDDLIRMLDQQLVDWLVTDIPAATNIYDYLETIHEVAPRCSLLLLSDHALDDLVASVPHDITILRPAASDGDLDVDLIDQIVSTVRRSSNRARGQLDQVFTQHALPMLFIEPESGTIIAVNDAAVRFYGYTRDELTAMSVDDINTLDSAEVAARRQEASDSDGKQFLFEHRTKSGEVRTVEVNSTPIEYGTRTVLFSIVQDVTARTEAERLLHESVTRYSQLAEQNVVGIYTIEDREFTYVNPKMAEIFGTTPETMIGTSVFEYIDDADQELVRDYLAAGEAGIEQSFHYTFAGKRADGASLILEAHGGRLETQSGVQIIGTLLDVTERETHEHELRRLSHALEYAAPAVYITDADATIEYANPAFERITGYSEAEALGETPTIIKSGRMTDAYYARLYETLQDGEVWEESVINRRKSGELYYAYQTIAPYLTDDGDVEGYVAIQTDVTDDRIEQQVIEVYQRILRHNLRNKLNVVRGHAELLEPEVVGLPLHDHVEAITEAATNLEKLSEKAQVARDALKFDDGDDVPCLDLAEMLDREKAVFEDTFPDASVDVMVSEEVLVYGAGRVEVCLHELLENAIIHNDSSEPLVEVDVSVDPDESMVEVVIRDSGPGITDLERDPIELGQETPIKHGRGIGLWVVEWVVTSLGGELEFAENTPRGLTVTLRLPYQSKHE